MYYYIIPCDFFLSYLTAGLVCTPGQNKELKPLTSILIKVAGLGAFRWVRTSPQDATGHFRKKGVQ